MSIFTNLLHDLVALITPRTCIVCGEEIDAGGEPVCDACRLRIPLTRFSNDNHNPMAERLRNTAPIERATALLWYVGASEWRAMIHRFKYMGAWYAAEKMGEWLGREMLRSNEFSDVELIIPIPLHPLKRIKRGYNQAEHIAIGVGRAMNLPYNFRSLRRTGNNASQTLISRVERWQNVESAFKVRNAKHLRGRHILLVDDVFTTGATTSSCIESIIAACEGDVRISVATLSASQQLLDEWVTKPDIQSASEQLFQKI